MCFFHLHDLVDQFYGVNRVSHECGVLELALEWPPGLIGFRIWWQSLGVAWGWTYFKTFHGLSTWNFEWLWCYTELFLLRIILFLFRLLSTHLNYLFLDLFVLVNGSLWLPTTQIENRFCKPLRVVSNWTTWQFCAHFLLGNSQWVHWVVGSVTEVLRWNVELLLLLIWLLNVVHELRVI